LYPGQIKTWQKALAAEGEQAFPGTGHQTETEAELRRLRRELEITRQERDILKKAVAIFSQGPK
jgi:transposase